MKKKFKYLLFSLLVMCCSCTVHLTEDIGIVTRVEECVDDTNDRISYNIYLRGVNKTISCYDSYGFRKTFYFKTGKLIYHVGDTVRFVNYSNRRNI